MEAGYFFIIYLSSGRVVVIKRQPDNRPGGLLICRVDARWLQVLPATGRGIISSRCRAT